MKPILIIIALLAVFTAAMYLFPQINYREMPQGLIEGNLTQGKPNWVSSFVATNNPHYIAPLELNSLTQLSECIVSNLPELSIQKIDTTQLIGYRQSTIFHFVDWFCIHADGNVVSSATIGYSDFGKNRELIEQIRTYCSKLSLKLSH